MAGTSREGTSRREDEADAARPDVDMGSDVHVRTSGFYVSTHQDQSTLRVLLVETDADRARSTRRGLRRASTEVIYVKTCATLEEATAAVRAEQFDVVLVDVEGKDGSLDPDALDRALTLASHGGATALVATGHSKDIEIAALVCSKGAQDYLRIDDCDESELLHSLRCAAERARRTQRLISDAYHDELTHLPNRRLLRRHFAEARYRAVRNTGQVAVLMIDLDGFKAVNDTLGHAAGDELLVAVAGRLSSCVRESDLVARVGGDEFVVLANSGPGMLVIADLRARIEAALREPFVVANRRVRVRASIGTATAAPDRACELATMLQAADDEMYHQKRLRQR